MATPKTEDERLDRIRLRWDPWDSYTRSVRDGESIKRKEPGCHLGARDAQQALESLVASGELKSLKRATEDTKDVVYFVQRESGGAVKIGHTTTGGLRRRLKELQSAHDEELVVRDVLDGGVWLESALHALFANQRLRGEWFRVTPKMTDLFPAVVG